LAIRQGYDKHKYRKTDKGISETEKWAKAREELVVQGFLLTHKTMSEEKRMAGTRDLFFSRFATMSDNEYVLFYT